MKIFKLSTFLSLLLFYTGAMAFDFEANGVYYNILSADEKTVEVTFANFFQPVYIGNLSVPSSVSHNGTEYEVTCIGDLAFQACHELTSVTLPNTIIRIGSAAFQDCTALESVTLGSSIVSIGNEAFGNCRNLSGIDLPASLESLGSNAFIYCLRLSEINVAEENKAYSSKDGVVYSKNFKSLYICPPGKKEVTVEEGVEEIASNAFYGCLSLSSLYLPETLLKIGSSSFFGCASLAEITIPQSVSEIEEGAFRSCDMLTSLALPGNLSKVADYLCFACFNIEEIYVPDSVTSIGSNAFAECFSLKYVNIGNGVTTIGDRAFHFCQELTRVVLGASVSKISVRCFMGCEKIEEIEAYPDIPPVVEGDLVEPAVYETAMLYVLPESLPAYSAENPWSNFHYFSPTLSGITSPEIFSENVITLTGLDGVIRYKGHYPLPSDIPHGFYIVTGGEKSYKIKL